MTTAVLNIPTTTGRHDSLRRIQGVATLHSVSKATILYAPLAILGAIFLLNYAIWWIIIDAGVPIAHSRSTTHLGYTGALGFIFAYALLVAIQMIARTFPFSLGFGVTRRDFYLGTALVFVILSVTFAAVVTILSIIEIATNGWGVQGYMFAPVYFTNPSWFLRFLMYFFVFLFVFFVGAASATTFVRWRSTGLTVFFGILALILVGSVALITLTGNWGKFGLWFVHAGPFGVTVWTVVPTIIAGIAGFFILRRATPKN